MSEGSGGDFSGAADLGDFSGWGGDYGADFGSPTSDLDFGGMQSVGITGPAAQYGYDGAFGSPMGGVYGPQSMEGESFGGIGSMADLMATVRAALNSPVGRFGRTALGIANPVAGLLANLGLGAANAARGSYGQLGSTTGGVIGSAAAGPAGGLLGSQVGGALGRGMSGGMSFGGGLAGLGGSVGAGVGGGGGLSSLLAGIYGYSQAKKLSDLAGLPSSDVTQLPGYQAGLQAVERRMKAQGYQGSGNMMAALSKYGGDFYDQAARQRIASSQAGMNPLVAQMSALGLIQTGIPALQDLFGG